MCGCLICFIIYPCSRETAWERFTEEQLLHQVTDPYGALRVFLRNFNLNEREVASHQIHPWEPLEQIFFWIFIGKKFTDRGFPWNQKVIE